MDDRTNIEQKTRKTLVFLRVVIGLMVTCLLLVFFESIVDHHIDRVVSATRETELQIVTAVESFKIEYGHFPGNRTDGRYEEAAGNAQIFAALLAIDRQQNPLGISYFEDRNARPRAGRLKDGFDEKTGVLLDVVGNPYRIRLRPASGQPFVSPYKDLPIAQENVLVWSLGKDDQQGSKTDPQKFQGGDDIASWGR